MVESRDESRSARRTLLAILIVGALLRVGVAAWFGNSGPVIVDEEHYHALAVHVVESGTFADASGQPSSLRPPIYATFLAGIYTIFGASQFVAVRLAQALLSLVTAWPLYLLAQRMFGRRVAVCTVGIFCLYPPLVVMTGLLLAETLFTTFLILVALACQRVLDTGTWRSAAALGVCLALAALTRSVLWLFPPFLFVFLLVALRAERWPRRILLSVTPVIVFGLVLAPWALRNARLEKTFVAVDTMGGRNFMMGNYEHTPMFRAWDTATMRTGTEQAWDRILVAEDPDFYDLTQGQRDKVAMRRGLTFAISHPWLTTQRCVVKCFDFWQLDRAFVAGLSKGFWGPVPRTFLIGTAVVLCGTYAVTVLSAIFGCVVAVPRDRRMHYFLLLMIGFVCAIHTAVFGHARYHQTLMPLLGIYASVLVTTAPSAWRARPRWPWIAAGCLSLLLVLSWIARAVLLDADRVL